MILAFLFDFRELLSLQPNSILLFGIIIRNFCSVLLPHSFLILFNNELSKLLIYQ